MLNPQHDCNLISFECCNKKVYQFQFDLLKYKLVKNIYNNMIYTKNLITIKLQLNI